MKVSFLAISIYVLFWGTFFTNPPKASIHRYQVCLDHAYVSENNKVGNEWISYLQVGEDTLRPGECLKLILTNRGPIRLEAHAIEVDPVHDDIGAKLEVFNYADFIAIEKTRLEIVVEVVENGGEHAGNLAVLKFKVRVERLP